MNSQALSLFQPYVSQRFLTVGLGVALLFLTSQLCIPLKPVPITLQTFGVMVVGSVFGRKEAWGTIILYLGLGALGFPMFASYHSGIPYMLGPTGGYLAGFFVAIILMVWLRGIVDMRLAWAKLLIVALGTVTIYAFGMLWLSRFVGSTQAMQLGVVPFIIPGCFKIFLLAAVLQYADPEAR